MENNIKCSSCGSEKIITNVKIIDHGFMDDKHDLAIEIQGKPNALIFKNTKKGILNAIVCCSCGRVDLFIENPEELWKTYNEE